METLDEEAIALEAIYCDKFTRLSDLAVRLIIEPEEDDSGPAVPLYLECTLPEGYPEALPTFDLSNTNNAWLLASVKAELLSALQEEAEAAKGGPMLYNLADWVSTNLRKYIARSLHEKASKATPETPIDGGDAEAAPASESYRDITRDMNKKQKARFYERFGLIEEKPRGWNWVDVVSHLSRR